MEPEGAYGKQPEAMKEMGGSLNRALFQGPPHAVRAYFEQYAARGSHMSRPDRLPLSSGLASTGSPAWRNKNCAVQAVPFLSFSPIFAQVAAQVEAI